MDSHPRPLSPSRLHNRRENHVSNILEDERPPTHQYMAEDVTLGLHSGESGTFVTFRFKAGGAEPEFICEIPSQDHEGLLAIQALLERLLQTMGQSTPSH
ncbi:hypothetical protein SAMN04487971_109148 [Paracoccus chinensis]|uniref:Uncharacterized protein n=1 Tax=Paracoccus chinensis TaxID=525640 RepID=A0A1G9JJK6_9RHOB|nr:hypothetical protein SAMN04487971_109148 [Paracoccus chinensis]